MLRCNTAVCLASCRAVAGRAVAGRAVELELSPAGRAVELELSPAGRAVASQVKYNTKFPLKGNVGTFKVPTKVASLLRCACAKRATYNKPVYIYSILSKYLITQLLLLLLPYKAYKPVIYIAFSESTSRPFALPLHYPEVPTQCHIVDYYLITML